MSPTLRESIYRSVLKSVVWGEPREEAFGIMQTNGITGEDAEALYVRARAERIAIIRGESFRHMIQGASLFAAGAGIFAPFWYGLGYIHRPLAVICGVLIVAGAWRALVGFVSLIMAHKKSGPVSTDSD